MSEQDTREQLEVDIQNLNGYPTLCKSLANYVAGLLIAKSVEAYKRGYDDGLHANTKAAFAAAKQAFGVEGDTREQLEVDLNNLCLDCLGLGWNAANDLKKAIRKLLDRQAAITRRETRQNWQDAPNVLDRSNLQIIAELTAERDKWTSNAETGFKRIKELEAERDELETKHERIVQEMVDANTRQCERTHELTAERDELQAVINAMELGQFYAMYKAKCEECEQLKKVVRTQADSFKKLEIELGKQ